MQQSAGHNRCLPESNNHDAEKLRTVNIAEPPDSLFELAKHGTGHDHLHNFGCALVDLADLDVAELALYSVLTAVAIAAHVLNSVTADIVSDGGSKELSLCSEEVVVLVIVFGNSCLPGQKTGCVDVCLILSHTELGVLESGDACKRSGKNCGT